MYNLKDRLINSSQAGMLGGETLRNIVLMYRNQNTPWTSITGVFVAVFFGTPVFFKGKVVVGI